MTSTPSFNGDASGQCRGPGLARKSTVTFHSGRATVMLLALSLIFLTTIVRAQGSEDETPASCLSAQQNLVKFDAPERTWAFYIKSLRAGDRDAALSAFLRGGLKTSLTALFKASSAAQLREMADSFGPLVRMEKSDSLASYLVTRKVGKSSIGGVTTFEYHPDCGGWRLASL